MLGFENNKWGYDDFRVYHSHSKLTIDFCTRTLEEAQSQFPLLFYRATKDYDIEYHWRGYSFILNLSDCQIRDEYPQFHGASFYFHITDAIKTCIANHRDNDNKENYRKNPDLPKRQRGRLQNPNSSKRPRISKNTPPLEDWWRMGFIFGEWTEEGGGGRRRRKEDKYYFLNAF